MTSLSNAGRSSLNPNQVNRAFTKGLYGVDPSEIQKKQQQVLSYQEELRLQVEEAKARKARQLQKEKQDDLKLQKKIEEDLLNEKASTAPKQKKNPFGEGPYKHQINKKSIESTANNNDNTFQMAPKEGPSQKQKETSYFDIQTSESRVSPPNQLSPNDPYELQEERYMKEEYQNRIRRFKESLDHKVEEIYRQIENSKSSGQKTDQILDQIKRKLKNNPYTVEYKEMQKSSVKMFEDEFSQFYKIPAQGSKVTGNSRIYSSANSRIKNLDYESESRYKSSLRNYNGDLSRQPSNNNSLLKKAYERPSGSEYNENGVGKWGVKKKDNFLGNRQALDFQVDRMMDNIDTILQDQRVEQDPNEY